MSIEMKIEPAYGLSVYINDEGRVEIVQEDPLGEPPMRIVLAEHEARALFNWLNDNVPG